MTHGPAWQRRDWLRAVGGAAAWGLPGSAALAAPSRWMPAAAVPMHGPSSHHPPHGDAALRFADQTLRQFLPLVLPGQRLRIVLSNEFGREPLVIGRAGVGWRAGPRGAALQPGSAQPLRFGGATGLRLAPGARATSDPVELPAPRLPRGGSRSAGDPSPPDLAVSLYLPQRTPSASWHLVGARTSHRAAGDRVDDLDLVPSSRPGVPPPAADRGLYFVAGAEVSAPRGAGLWIAFGDSITDGNWYPADTDGSWPAHWHARWRERRAPGAPPVGVLNAGVSGNRLLVPLDGPSGLQRFARDVLTVPGALGVVLMIGINDLGGAARGALPRAEAALREALTGLAAQARRRRLKVVAATLTPVGGSVYDRPEVEAARQRHNAWLRRWEVDALVDFDRLVRDPGAPTRFRPGWSSDGLHPDAPAYAAMGREIDRVLHARGLAPRG